MHVKFQAYKKDYFNKPQIAWVRDGSDWILGEGM